MVYEKEGKKYVYPKFKEGDKVKMKEGILFDDPLMIIKDSSPSLGQRGIYFQYKVVPLTNAYEFAWVWESDITKISPDINPKKAKEIKSLKKRLRIK